MEGTQRSGLLGLTLALLLLGAVMPAAPAGAGGSDPCQIEPVTEHITRSNPLAGRNTASETLYFFVTDPAAAQHSDTVNGVDAYVIDLGCENLSSRTFELDAVKKDTLGDYELGVKFFDQNLDQLGHEDGDVNEMIEGDVPDDSRYAVVLLEQGPIASGFTLNHDTGIYSVKFAFDMD